MDPEIIDWLNILNIILGILSITVTFIFAFKKKILESKIYKNIISKINFYYLWSIERKFLIGSLIFFLISIFFLTLFVYANIFPTQGWRSFNNGPSDFIGFGQGEILNHISNQSALLINKDQEFIWKRGWNENTKLRRLDLNYSTPGTKIILHLGGVTENSYELNGTSKLVIDNISLPYEKYRSYYLGITNIGEAPLYIYNIGTEEDIITTTEKTMPIFLIGYIFLFPSYFLYKQHKKIKQTKIKSIDLLYKDAKLADKIKDIEMDSSFA